MLHLSKKIILTTIGSIILAFSLGVFIFFNFIPEKGAFKPEQIAENFFSWYIQQPVKPILSGGYKVNEFLTSNFIKKISKSSSDFQKTGIDPFLCSSGIPAFSLEEEPKVLAGKAQAIFNQKEGIQKNQMKVTLVLQKREWKIDNIDCFISKDRELEIRVYFHNSDEEDVVEDCSKPSSVKRVVIEGKDISETAKRTFKELLLGPTAFEKIHKYFSWFSKDTADILESFKIKNGIAYVSLKHDFTSIIPEVSSPCAGAEFLSEMTQTLKQFPEIKDVVFAIDGNVAWFYSYLELPCPDISNNCKSDEF